MVFTQLLWFHALLDLETYLIDTTEFLTFANTLHSQRCKRLTHAIGHSHELTFHLGLSTRGITGTSSTRSQLVDNTFIQL